jgi:hypothetical protein
MSKEAKKISIEITEPPGDPEAFMAWARKYGAMIARTHFKNHVFDRAGTVRMSPEALATMLAFGFEMGAKAERSATWRAIDPRVSEATPPKILVREDCIEEGP